MGVVDKLTETIRDDANQSKTDSPSAREAMESGDASATSSQSNVDSQTQEKSVVDTVKDAVASGEAAVVGTCKETVGTVKEAVGLGGKGSAQSLRPATREEMAEARLPHAYRDGCANLLIPLNNCRFENYWLPWKCVQERHTYEKCQYEDFLRRVKKMDELRAAKGPGTRFN